jgi:two-component sensor histidine kinase
MVLLAASLALMTHRLLADEALAGEIRALEEGLQAGAEPAGPPARPHPAGLGAAALLPALATLDRLVEDYPELGPAQALLRLRLPADPAGEAPHRAVPAAAQAPEETLLRRIALLHEDAVLRQRHELGAAVLGVLGGGVLLGLALRRAQGEARSQARQAARAQAQIRALAEAAPLGMALLDPELRIAAGNARFAQLAGTAEAALPGRLLAETLPWLHAALAAVPPGSLVHGTGAAIAPRILAAPDADGTDRHYHLAVELLQEPDVAAHVCLIVMDVTERATMEAWRDELVAELNHRVKNTLATVQSLAAQTLRGAALDPQRFAADFSGRLAALSRSHELLAAVGWSQATLGAVVQAALAPWQDGGRLRVEGPEGPLLRPGQAQALVIALSELASNAAHHGALRGGGQVALRWECLTDGMLRLVWCEAGGPPLAGRPLRQGFGLRFLERGLAHDLGPGTEVRLSFDTGGLCCEVRFRSLEPRHCLAVQAA